MNEQLLILKENCVVMTARDMLSLLDVAITRGEALGYDSDDAYRNMREALYFQHPYLLDTLDAFDGDDAWTPAPNGDPHLHHQLE
jgi:hypothetical protein